MPSSLEDRPDVRSSLAFSAPLLLTAFLALPLLWFLLRVVPPKPREVSFPPLRLLLGITPKEESAARTPWWLTALRMLLAALVILAAAGPIWNPPATAPTGSGPLLIVIDQGWPAAASWEARRSAAAALIDEAETNGRGVALIPTGDVPREATLSTPAAARDHLRSLEPVPYAPARKEALAMAGRLLGTEPAPASSTFPMASTLAPIPTPPAPSPISARAHACWWWAAASPRRLPWPARKTLPRRSR